MGLFAAVMHNHYGIHKNNIIMLINNGTYKDF